MKRHARTERDGPGRACGGCALVAGCDQKARQFSVPLSGASLACAAIGFFGLPAIGALAVSACFPGQPLLQIFGALGGMAGGMVAASVGARIACDRRSSKV